MNPSNTNGWNVAELNGGLLLSSTDFSVQFSSSEVDKLLNILNTNQTGKLRDVSGTLVQARPEKDHVILTRVNDKYYPDGIILPVDAFSELEANDAPIIEGLKPAYRRVGSKIKRGFRVTSGRHKGQVVSNPATAHKPPISGRTRAKLRAAAKRNKLIRALKSRLTRRKGASLRLRRLNHTN
jgi:hypothetical protein